MIRNNIHKPYFLCWLLIIIMIVCSMIVLGGYVRLSGSGLSMTKWEPLQVFPPVNQDQWHNEFLNYQESPEFQLINTNISLSDFKKIYYIEYFHRNLARLLFLITVIPIIFFYKHRQYLIFQIKIIFLIGVQGLFGWLMVASGLFKHPFVNHFNLALHLLMAFFLLEILFYKFLENCYTWQTVFVFNKSKTKFLLNFLIFIIFFFVVCQISVGALVAGLHAGKIFTTFPFMEDKIIPDFLQFNSHFLQDPATLNFVHRWLGIFIGSVSFVYLMISYYFFNIKKYILYALVLNIMVLMQITLGIITLINVVPINLALMHQFAAILLFLVVIINILHNQRCQVI